MFIRKCTVLAAASLMIANCASTPERLPQLGEDVSSSLSAVGVITIGPSIWGELDGPVGVADQVAVGIIDEEGVGAAGGAQGGALLAGVYCGPAFALCVLGAATVGGMAVLVGGSERGEIGSLQDAIPESTVAEIETALARAIADHELQSDLRSRVLQNIGNATMGVDLGAGATVPAESPDYVSFRDQGVDAVLEISLTQLGFASEGGDEPVLALVITASARLIGVPDSGILWNVEQVTYESAEGAFSFWTEGDSGLLQAEIDNGLDVLISQIGEALFGAPAT